jgi:ABC-type Fe3+ transport system substrate-binding protein
LLPLTEDTSLLKLSTSACVTIFLAAVFVIGTAATTYYYYGMPHPTYLRILYTHSDEMVEEIVSDFEKWYQEQPKYGRPIEVTTIHTDPQTAFEKATTIFRKAEAEIWWGGSLSLFKKAYGRLLPYNSSRKSDINLTSPCPLMDLSGNTPRWYAASLYGLGVMYNKHRLNELGLQIPQTWENLTMDGYQRNITMVDPTASESMSPFITLTLQSKNWTGGWEYLVTLSALIEQYDTEEHDSALKVSSDYLPLAIVPDSYAYDRMTIGIPEINFTYLDGTILQPDPIAIINRGTYINEAKAFIDYILTQQAQNIIGKYLLPMRQDSDNFPSQCSPFAPEFPHIYRYNETLQQIISDYYKTWITERHTQIKNAWREIGEANVSSSYYELAVSNFTYAGYYINRSELELIYNETEGWTNAENVTSYMNEWRNASGKAYNYAKENARKSKAR